VKLRAFLISSLLALAGCAPRVPSSTEVLEAASRDVLLPDASPRTMALAGFHALLAESDAAKAQKYFDASVAADAREPWALYGQQVLALRVSHPERALIAALDLCERAPAHPLSSAAARLVFDSAGASGSGDDLILSRAPALLEGGLAGDAAQLIRSAVANIQLTRGELTDEAATLAAMGTPTTCTLIGPLSPFHTLALKTPTEPERSGKVEPQSVAVPLDGSMRTLLFPDGRLSLAAEPAQGDVYLTAVDFELAVAGTYVVRTVTQMDHTATLDGTALFTRFTWDAPASTLTSAAVALEPGTHRLMVRMARDDQQGHLNLQVMRLDGSPAQLVFRPAKGDAAKWAEHSVELLPQPPGIYGSTAALAAALAPEVGNGLAAFVAARDGMNRDRDGAKRLLAELPQSLSGAVAAVLKAELQLGDRTVPTKVARGRATRDLEAALSKDPGLVQAQLLTATLALDDGRHLDALEILKAARAAHAPPGAPLLELEARVELGLGIDAQAVVTALAADEQRPGDCDALGLRYDIARRRDAALDSDALLPQLRKCPGALGREAEALRGRGKLNEAAKVYEAMLERDPGQVAVGTLLANSWISLKRFDDAAALLKRLSAQWPRNATVLKQLGEVYEYARQPELALRAREQALLRDGSDLGLRRLVERAKTGRELLQSRAISTEEALKAYAAAPGAEDVPAAYILDAAAVRAWPDGSQVDRIHIIQKALDQSGVSEIGEVNIPSGAVLLKLRTLKADGRSLEPESIDGKETVSLPGVQVGDFVEYEYLLAHPPRGPTQPGFTASSFYFQIARQPNNWSTYVVVADKGTGMKVDAHNMEAPAPHVEGEEEVFTHEERRVTPYIPEPQGPPSGNEFLPFVSVGAGTTGNEGLVAAYADAFLDKGQVTTEVAAFARAASEGKSGVEQVRAIYTAVMDRLSGHDAGLTVSAASSVAQDRGSRLWLTYAALKAVGVDVRLAVARTFTADVTPYVFPSEQLLPYLCLRAEVKEGKGMQTLWLDPLVRYAPFGELPEIATGRDGYLMPEPGRPIEKIQTPARVQRPGKEIALQLELTPDGKLSGTGVESYQGFEAAQLAEALDAIAPDQREQALQSALSRYFGGADLSKLELDFKRTVGAPVVVRYAFTAPRFARPEGDHRLVLGGATFPMLLGRRFLQLSNRRTALFLEGTEASHTVATLKLPAGWSLAGAVPQLTSKCDYGSFVRKESQAGQVLTLEEDYQLSMARVPPKAYEDFARFAGEVDLIQGRDLLIERKP
jgi:tetratricopeptide (TPR) repeat protein